MSITNFEDFTHELNDYEQNKLLPWVVDQLQPRRGAYNAITGAHLCTKAKLAGMELKGARLRKLIHVIRITGLVPCLVATSKGYFIAEHPEQVESFRLSLRQRARSICDIDDAMGRQQPRPTN